MSNIALLKSPVEIKMNVAANMRARRKLLKITQQELSRRSAVSLGSIKRFEQTGEISLSSLVMISFVLGCQDDFEALFAPKPYTTMKELIEAKKRKNK